MSIFTRGTEAATFRRRWLGYDCAEVDEFLRQTEVDRQRLQEDLAQLEAVMAGHGEERRREQERLAALRTEIASCLETSIGALRKATERLSPPQGASGPQSVADEPRQAAWFVTPRAKRRRRLSMPAWASGPRQRVMIAVGSAAVLVLAVVSYQYQPRASEMPAPVQDTRTALSEPITAPVVSVPPAPVVQEVAGLVLTLTALRPCWIGTSIDGGQRLERELKPHETIMLRADREVVVRIGDASALSVLINNELAKPFGAPGQVVTTRITPANYRSFLAGS
jgi:DivIVA domain-containing protein